MCSRLREEVGQPAGVELAPAAPAQREQLLPPRAELALERGDELEGVGCEDALCRRAGIGQNVDTRRDRRRHGHRLTRVGLPRAFVEAVEAALPGAALLTEPEELRTYECDGLTGRRVIPALVCLPQTTDEVQAVVRACPAHGIPFVARGAGTGLSGGALPVAEGIVISLARMNRVLDVDLDAERVVVQPGVTNLQVTEAVAADGYYYAPDPSSQQVCTIGGNVAENSGGAHCLKYGFTVNHVLAAVVVLPDGEVVALLRSTTPDPTCSASSSAPRARSGSRPRSRSACSARPELVVTLLAAFDSTDAAGAAVSDVIAAGILPAAVEMMDRLTLEAARRPIAAGLSARRGPR